jgi:hypothetical protein
MYKILVFSDGSIYVHEPDVRWGRVNISTDPFLVDPEAKVEVCYIAVADSDIKTDNKGSTMPITTAWLKFLDNFHTPQASNWLWTPFMLWINKRFIGDTLGSTLADGASLVPMPECITGSCNILRVTGETPTHYIVWALPTDTDISKLDPKRTNWKNFPWVFWKAQARTRTNQIQNVGAGLDVWQMNIRKPKNTHYIHKSRFTLFQKPPFTVTYNYKSYNIIGYQFIGASVYGISDNHDRIPLLICEKPGVIIHPTEWRGGQPVIPPA